MLVRAQPVLLVFSGHGAVLLVFSGHGALNVKLRTLENFTLYLRNRQSGNLRAIESCVCSIRSIERNMMSFLRTVWDPGWKKFKSWINTQDLQH
jgi:hypothetical protein